MGRITCEDAAQKICGFALIDHPASCAMRQCYNTIYVGVGIENLSREMRSDAASHGGGTVDRCHHSNVVPGTYAAVRPTKTEKSDFFAGRQLCRRRRRSNRIIPFEVAHNEIVSMNVIPCHDGLRSKANDLIEFTYWRASGDGFEGQLVAGRNIGDRRDLQLGEKFPGFYRPNCHCNVVANAELEKLRHRKMETPEKWYDQMYSLWRVST